jgi:hypothetical protein
MITYLTVIKKKHERHLSLWSLALGVYWCYGWTVACVSRCVTIQFLNTVSFRYFNLNTCTKNSLPKLFLSLGNLDDPLCGKCNHWCSFNLEYMRFVNLLKCNSRLKVEPPSLAIAHSRNKRVSQQSECPIETSKSTQNTPKFTTFSSNHR